MWCLLLVNLSVISRELIFVCISTTAHFQTETPIFGIVYMKCVVCRRDFNEVCVDAIEHMCAKHQQPAPRRKHVNSNDITHRRWTNQYTSPSSCYKRRTSSHLYVSLAFMCFHRTLYIRSYEYIYLTDRCLARFGRANCRLAAANCKLD